MEREITLKAIGQFGIELDPETIEYLSQVIEWDYPTMEDPITLTVDNYVDKLLYFFKAQWEVDLDYNYDNFVESYSSASFNDFIRVHVVYLMHTARIVTANLYPQKEVW